MYSTVTSCDSSLMVCFNYEHSIHYMHNSNALFRLMPYCRYNFDSLCY